MNRIYLYSESKQEFFYIYDRVKDTRTNQIGIITKIYENIKFLNKKNLIKVDYGTTKRIYSELDQQFLLTL
jgi:hypothetical protein